MANSPRHWAVVPAAGVGKRMGADRPKQYLPLAGRTVIEHTLERLADHPGIAGVVVALGHQDGYWPALSLGFDKPLWRVDGGEERCHSVLNALDFLHAQADDGDWVLVHDAARPCIRHGDLDRLIHALADHAVGGLLGVPVSDTVKRCNPSDEVLETVPRDDLWRALTPQMFRLGALRTALREAIEGGRLVTDDASAIELAGHRPLMVEGSVDNIKITRPEDLPLAELFIQQQAG